ncbi:MAG: mannose-6-phosphate isomerase, class I [Acidothermus sp.]|nr:mannose-6-phosphate isomerase, class I [Acidothermus sp.]
MRVWRMRNRVMPYAWGSRSALASLQGRPPAAQPEAELWMGAHPQAPSEVEVEGRAVPLPELIAAQPEAILGAEVMKHFGPTLPFLVKILAAERPLSLQVHPPAEIATAGFRAEDAAGIDRRAPWRTYRDPNAKPELLLALGPFRALHGFAPPAESARRLERLASKRLTPLVDRLRRGDPPGDVFLDLLAWPDDDRAALVAEAAAAAGTDSSPLASLVGSLSRLHPADPGVVGVLLLNYVELSPGEALYIRPGELHAYLDGIGLEILGNSDNVVRAGLTEKHLALSELARSLCREPTPAHLLTATDDGRGGRCFAVRQDEFALTVVEVADVPRELIPRSAEVLVVLDGAVRLETDDGVLPLGRTDSAFVAADAGVLRLTGGGTVARVRPGVVVQCGAGAEQTLEPQR